MQTRHPITGIRGTTHLITRLFRYRSSKSYAVEYSDRYNTLINWSRFHVPLNTKQVISQNSSMSDVSVKKTNYITTQKHKELKPGLVV